MAKKKVMKKRENMLKEKSILFLLIGFIFFNCFLAIYSLITDNLYALKGQAGFVVLAAVIYLLRKQIKLTGTAFFFLLLGMSLHLSHVLGRFYYASPVMLPWDMITHGISFIGITLLFFDYNKEFIDNKKIFNSWNALMFITIFLAVAGVGVIIELSEYAGYAILGMKDGALLFGGGDFGNVAITSDVASEMEFRSGGWYDSMSDLLINSYVSFLTLLLCFAAYFYKARKR